MDLDPDEFDKEHFELYCYVFLGGKIKNLTSRKKRVCVFCWNESKEFISDFWKQVTGRELRYESKSKGRLGKNRLVVLNYAKLDKLIKKYSLPFHKTKRLNKKVISALPDDYKLLMLSKLVECKFDLRVRDRSLIFVSAHKSLQTLCQELLFDFGIRHTLSSFMRNRGKGFLAPNRMGKTYTVLVNFVDAVMLTRMVFPYIRFERQKLLLEYVLRSVSKLRPDYFQLVSSAV